MTALDDVARPQWPTRGSEDHVLWTFLDFERATLAKKCAGLTTEQLATKSMPPSNLSLLGLLRHSVDHEIYWYEQIFLGRDTASAFESNSDPDFDFNGLESASVETVVDQWLRQCEISRSIVAGRSLDDARAVTPDFLEAPVPLRLLAVQSIEEYARHTKLVSERTTDQPRAPLPAPLPLPTPSVKTLLVAAWFCSDIGPCVPT